MLDKYISGYSDRISPEAPVPVVKVENESIFLGGAGNVVANLSGLGACVYPIGIIGNDEPGRTIISMLNKIKIRSDYIYISENNKSTLKTRIVANNQQLLRVDWDQDFISKKIIVKIKTYIEEIIRKIDLIIISDYNKGLCTNEIVEHTIGISKKYDKLVFVDPKGIDFSKYKGANLIKPNSLETREIVPFKLKNEVSFEKASQWIIDSYNIDVCVITRGKDGMILNNNGKICSLQTVAREVFDVSGAGDTVIAVLAIFIVLGYSYERSAELANYAARIVVSHFGTWPIDIKFLLNKMQENE